MVGLQQSVLGALVEVVVDRQVAEVEDQVAHPGVLPVHQDGVIGPGVGGRHVARQQIVVTGDRTIEGQGLGDPVHQVLSL